MFTEIIKYPFHRMAQLYQNPEAETENWKLTTMKVSYPKDYYQIIDGGIPAGTYVGLQCKNPLKFHMDSSCMMSDTPMEKFTNQRFLNYAYGNVLIAGLGIGMLPASLAERDDITSITIIEYSQEIIDLVEPFIRKYVKHQEKIKIILADAYEYPKTYNGPKYDWVWLDIWSEFPGYTEDLSMLDTICELYYPITKSACHVSTWGYDFVFEGFDVSPIETHEYGEYLVDLIIAEELLDETDWTGRQEMTKMSMELRRLGIDDEDKPPVLRNPEINNSFQIDKNGDTYFMINGDKIFI